MQQNEITKFFAPFQIEVNNQWQLMKEFIFSKDKSAKEKAGAWARMLLMAYGMNMLAEGLRGSGVTFDLIGALQEAIDGWDDDEDANTWERGWKVAGRLAGEVISNMPYGSQVASFLIPDETQRENLFGEGDPTRFGTGNIVMSAFSAFVVDLMNGDDISDSGFALAASFSPIGYGSQIKKTTGTLQDMGILPNVSLSTSEGLKVSREKGSYTSGGKYRFDIDTSKPLNVAKGLAFGRWATDEGKEYIANGSKAALSASAAEKAKAFEKAYGVSVSDYAKIYAATKGLESDKDEGGNAIMPGSTKETSTKKSKSTKIKEVIDNMTQGMDTATRKKLYSEMGVSEKVW
jgi:hypothetical protein